MGVLSLPNVTERLPDENLDEVGLGQMSGVIADALRYIEAICNTNNVNISLLYIANLDAVVLSKVGNYVAAGSLFIEGTS